MTTLTRRQLFQRIAGCGVVAVGGGYYANRIEPFWPKFPEIPIRLKGMAKSFDGCRIAQVTDMHTGRAPYPYLEKVIDTVAKLNPDMVAFTGDLVHHNSEMIEPVTRLIKRLSCPVMVSFGNHDFAPFRGDDDPYDPDLNEKLQTALTAIGCHVLQNASLSFDRGNDRIWIVGLDDLWFGDFNPELAFANVPIGETTIALSHNPDTAEMLADHRPDLILSGHTHGGQIRLPYFGALRLNVAQPQYDMGHFQLPHSQLFVSTGVGYIRKIRFNCRPEVPVFRLVSV
jgi:predicted MPP superfamily phosphohydrolase